MKKLLLSALILLSVLCIYGYFETDVFENTNASPDARASIVTQDKVEEIDPYSVVPGERIGTVYLGQSPPQANSVFSKLLEDNRHKLPNCNFRRMVWHLNISTFEGSIVEASISDANRVEQIKIYGERFYTDSDINAAMELSTFIEKYDQTAKLEAFADYGLGTNSKSVHRYSGYLVNQKQGIAFEFVELRDDGKWLLNSISVFDQSKYFAPRYGCQVPESSYWQKLDEINLQEISKRNHGKDDSAQ